MARVERTGEVQCVGVTAAPEGRRGAIAKELEGADLGDHRREARLLRIAEAVAAHPERSLPGVFENDDAALEAAYRFFNNVAVTPAALLQPHVRATVERCGSLATVLAVHDTTVFGYRAGGKRHGLGSHGPAQQFFAHATLAVSADEAHVPLGILAQRTYVRRGDGGDGTESERWLDQANAVEQLGIEASRIVHVEDREGDNYVALSAHVVAGQRFVIRADDDRTLVPTEIDSSHSLREALERTVCQAMREVALAPRGKHGPGNERGRRHPPRCARLANLHVGAARVTLRRPSTYASPTPKGCPLHVVHVWEPSPPVGEAPVRWILLTTEPIDTPEQLLAIVDIYRARWRIEELFKALKTGCAFEQKQLESYEGLVNALAVYLPIAWRLLHLRALSRDDSEAPATGLLDADEWDVLRACAKRSLPREPTHRQLLLAIAALGGHLSHNGDPGWQTLGRGMERLLARVEGFRLHRKICSDRDQS